MKTFWKYYSGQSQFLPSWTYNRFIFWLFHPRYIADNKFRWFGITFNIPDDYGGDTLFIYWRRMRKQ